MVHTYQEISKMKKALVIAIAIVALASMAMAQTWSTTVPGGVTAPPKGLTIDKLGAHQNGGRGCVGCHAPHSGARGNGGVLSWDGSAYVSVAVDGISGEDALWGQDLGPIYGKALDFAGGYSVTVTESSPARQITGIAMCLSCHDGNVAKGAMMQNKSFEQAAGMLPAGYGTQDIPTLLGADGGSYGNYKNDHPVGPMAKLGTLSGIKASTNFFALSGQGGTIGKGSAFAGSAMENFYKNYGLPLIVDARSGAGFATDVSANLDDAYVVCTTCHTPHSMYTTSAKLNGVGMGTVPTFFFIAAPYNPGANVADGTKASSATQFCRQCHFTGAGGSNEGSGINIPTAF
jgi:hypothetical protein